MAHVRIAIPCTDYEYDGQELGALGKHYIGLTRLWCSAWRHWAGIFSVPIGFSDSEPPNSRWDRSRSSGTEVTLDAAGLYCV